MITAEEIKDLVKWQTEKASRLVGRDELMAVQITVPVASLMVLGEIALNLIELNRRAELVLIELQTANQR